MKVYDGIASFRHHSYKLISVPRHISIEQLIGAAMWAFHLTGDPGTMAIESNLNLICIFIILSVCLCSGFLFNRSVRQFREGNRRAQSHLFADQDRWTQTGTPAQIPVSLINSR